MGIFGFPMYDVENASIEDISLENRLLAPLLQGKENLTDGLFPHYFPLLFDSLYSSQKKERYIFTEQGRHKSTFTNIGMYKDECLSYFIYPLQTKELKNIDNILFSSNFALDLIYENNPEIDTLIHRRFSKNCFDCPTSNHLTKTVAKLRGVKDLYFTYADVFPVSKGLDTPSRGLAMKMDNGYMVYLWYEEIDLFGCSCL
jgi:hypothetical protein